MSRFHANCSKCADEQEQPNRCKAAPKLASKPFCDCKLCTCKECPDILNLLSITMTEKTCHFAPKVAKDSKCPCPPPPDLQRSSLLDVLSSEKDCPCDVVARAVRSHVHMNIGLTNRRTEMNGGKQAEDITDITPDK